MGKKVSQFTEATLPLTGEEYLPILQGGNRKVKVKNLPGGAGEKWQGTYLTVAALIAANKGGDK